MSLRGLTMAIVTLSNLGFNTHVYGRGLLGGGGGVRPMSHVIIMWAWGGFATKNSQGSYLIASTVNRFSGEGFNGFKIDTALSNTLDVPCSSLV